jgi:hypothetical protein
MTIRAIYRKGKPPRFKHRDGYDKGEEYFANKDNGEWRFEENRAKIIGKYEGPEAEKKWRNRHQDIVLKLMEDRPFGVQKVVKAYVLHNCHPVAVEQDGSTTASAINVAIMHINTTFNYDGFTQGA